MRQVDQGNGSATDYITRFKQEAETSGVTDEKTLKMYFQYGLNRALSNRIYRGTLPRTLQEWYTQAILFDTHGEGATIPEGEKQAWTEVNGFRHYHSQEETQRY